MSCLNLNSVMLAGHIATDPELKQTQSGISVCNFNLAVNRRKAEGEPKTDFITVIAWRKTAETVCKYFQKGSAICLSGRIETRDYTDRNNQKRRAVEVIANEVFFVDSRQDAGGRVYSDPGYGQAPAPQYQSPQAPRFEELKTDEDLPF